MTLFDALRILANCHTRDDDWVGFCVESTVAPWSVSEHSQGDYIKAWGVVREQMHMQTEGRHKKSA